MLYFDRGFKKCFDPFQKHKKSTTDGLRVIDLQVAEQFMDNFQIKVAPGDKLCKNCSMDVSNRLKKIEEHGQNTQQSLQASNFFVLALRKNISINQYNDASLKDLKYLDSRDAP